MFVERIPRTQRVDAIVNQIAGDGDISSLY
jgi:hypothetical protein